MSFGFLLTASSYSLTASPNLASLNNEFPFSLCSSDRPGLI